jgi:hypothetical protein
MDGNGPSDADASTDVRRECVPAASETVVSVGAGTSITPVLTGSSGVTRILR